MEQLAYHVKQRFPEAFRWIEVAARGVTVLRYGRRIRRARADAVVQGTVRGEAAVMRPLGLDDLDALYEFLAEQPVEHLRYFRPHGFDRGALRAVLGAGAFLNYGLFVGDRLAAYALLKVSPTGSAFRGRLVGSGWGGIGLGRFLAEYVYWQASLAGLRARATISRSNKASLRSLETRNAYRVLAELPDDYLLIEFPTGSPKTPVLAVGEKASESYQSTNMTDPCERTLGGGRA